MRASADAARASRLAIGFFGAVTGLDQRQRQFVRHDHLSAGFRQRLDPVRREERLGEDARTELKGEDVNLDDFLSWLKDDFKVSHSYFISHKESFNQILPRGYVADLGRRDRAQGGRA